MNAIKTIKSSNVLFIDPLKSIQLRTNLQQMTNTQTLGAFQADTMKISEQFSCFFYIGISVENIGPNVYGQCHISIF